MPRRRSSNSLTSTSSPKLVKNKGKTVDAPVHSKNIIVISGIVVTLALILFEFRHDILRFTENTLFLKRYTTEESFHSTEQETGGWRVANNKTKQRYGSDFCNIDRKWAHELNDREFENVYRHKRPLIVTFKTGAKDWTDPTKWTVDSLKQEYGDWSVLHGNSREIVRRGGSGYKDSSFSEYVDKLMSDKDNTGEPSYVFDRDFYRDSSLSSTLKPPSYFQIKDAMDDSIFFLGSSGSGVSFHKHADAWNGVIYGFKRWFLYPVNKTPPGGVYPGYTQLEWYNQIYPELSPEDKPLECIQRPGEILYLPEGTYHGTINLGDTIAIGIQKKEAVTTTEKLFYDERKIVESMWNKNENEKQQLLKKKQAVIEQLLQELPENAEVYMKAGSLYAELGNLMKAKVLTQKAIELDRYFVIAILNLAGIETKLGNMDEAERLYKHAEQMNPNLWDVYAQYGDFLLESGRARDAVLVYKKGTEVEPNSLPFWIQLRHAQVASGDEEGAEESQRVIDRLKTI